MKLSKKTILIGISTLLVAGAGLAYYFISKDKEDVLGWKDGSWLYRKSIAVANSGAELINEEVLIEIDTATLIGASKLENTCADLRFTDSDDNTYLAYWIEGGCNTATTQVWVRIPSLTAGGKTIYMYYGNPSAGNNEEAWAGKFILMKDAACDSGWTAESASGGDFYQRYPYPATTYGGTGGATGYSHPTLTRATSTVSTGTATNIGAGLGQAGAHSHNNVSFVIPSVTALPPYLNMIVCSNSKLVAKQNSVSIFASTVPTGFTRFAALDSKFPRGEATYGGTSTTTTHTHTVTAVATSSLSASRTCISGSTATPSATHTHTFAAFATGTGNQTPVYKNTIYGEANSDIKAPSGIIEMVNSVPPMGWTQYSALDGYFPFGATTFGTTGGSATHTHSISARTSGAYSGSVTCSTAATTASVPRAHTHTTTATTSGTATNIPPYIQTILVQKKTSQSITFNSEERKNEAPTAPTALQTQGQTDPIGITNYPVDFSAVFNDPNSIDSASYYQIEVNTASDFTGTVMWDSTQTSLSPTVANGVRSQGLDYSGTALEYGTTYYWRIKFWDDNTTQGILSSVWSATAQFTMNTPPSDPTDLLTDGSTDPIGLTNLTPHFSAVFNDPDTTDVGSSYIVLVNTASDFTGTTMWDSTLTALSPTVVNGARSQDIVYAGSTLQYGTTYYWRIMFFDNYGMQSTYPAAQFTMNAAPNTPTDLLTEGTTNPASVTNLTPEFSAIFSDPNTSDEGAHYQIEVNTASNFTGTVMWNSTQTALTPTIVNGVRSQDISYAGSALQDGITYHWRIKFWDDKGTPGPTETAQFTTNIGPGEPTNLLTEGDTDPSKIADFTPEFSAIFNDVNTTDTGDYYQIEVNTASDFTGTVMWDSTKTTISPALANGARSQDISYAGSTLQGGTTYYWRIRFWDSNDTQGTLSSVAQFTTNAAPTAPTGLLTEGATNPANLTTFTPKFSAIFNDPNGSDTASAYQIEVNTASDFTGAIMWDSTQIAISPALANGVRSQDITYAGSTLNSYFTYYWRIKFWDDMGTPGTTANGQFNIIVTSWQNAYLQYKQPVLAENTTGSTLTNEDVLIQMDTATLIGAGKMQADCDDIRFFDSDDSTSLQYWIEGKCNTSSTQVWVRAPSLPNGGKTIFMYYGDPNASNAEQTWTGNVIMFADTTCPTGWTRASDLDNKFLYGGTTYGTTGGGTSHTHSDAICTSSSISTTSIAGTIGGSLTGTTITHTHTSLRATLLSATVVPPYEGMIACYSNTFLFSQGLISIFDTSTPSGWTRYSGLDDRFVQAKSTYGETGGSATHTHSTTTGYTTGTTGDTQTVYPQFSATGGTVTYTDSNGLNPRSTPAYAGGYTVHTFTSGGTFTATGSGNIDYLIVGAGGSGSKGDNLSGGGGGGGGLLHNENVTLPSGSYPIAVGASSGLNSSFNGLTAIGGGYGWGASGGSGGGGGASWGGGGSGTAGQGYNGGAANRYSGGGGGGASGPGVAAPDSWTGGAGGPGFTSSITGSSVSYAIGGRGANDAVYNGSAGAANTGNGGGGGGSQGSPAAGGSGIVIIRYQTIPSGGGSVASGTHTHTSNSATSTTVSNLPPYLDMVFAKANTDQYVTEDNVIATSAIPPLGWSRFTALDSKFPRGSATYGTTGGATTHVHDVTVNTGGPSATVDGGGIGTNYADSTHTHSCTTASDTGSSLPPYSTVIYAQRKASQATTSTTEQVGNTPPNAPTNLLTEGQTNPTELDDINPEFSAIFTDADATDSAIHYQIQVNTSSSFTGEMVWDSTQTSLSPSVSNGARSQDISYAGSTLNPYFTYYWRIRFWDNNSIGSINGAWSSPASFSVKITTWGLFDNWYRYPIVAGNSTGSTLTNEDVLVELDTATLIGAGKMQADCDDIRFLDGDDTTGLQYWVEGKCNTSSTQIWVRVPSIPNGGKTIFMYYGDPNATNDEAEWTGSVIMFADTTCPTGWTRAADLDNKFLYGGTTYGTTGGGTSHTHSDAICTSSSINTTSVAGTSGGVLGGSTITHTHTSLRATLLSTTVVPPYEGMIACYSNTFLFSQGLISIFNTSTPSGWTRFSSLDDRFVQAKDTYGSTGGSGTHTHSTTTGYTTGTASDTQSLLNSFSTTGGTVTTDGSYTYNTFTSSGTLTVAGSGTVDVFIVAGGRTGGNPNGGSSGGNGGEVLYNTGVALTTGNYSIVIGGSDQNSTALGYTARTGYGATGGIGSNPTNPGAAGTVSPFNGVRYGAGGGSGGVGTYGDIPGGAGGATGGGSGGYVVAIWGSPWDGRGNAYQGTAGGTNTGGGGGGYAEGAYSSAPASAGGSGIVVTRRQTASGSSGTYASSSHTHDSASATPTTVSNLPPYLDVVFAKANTDQYVTVNNVIATTILPPLGWSRYTALDNKFPRGAITYGATGGATTHLHDVSTTTGTPSGSADGGGAGTTYADSTHTHSCTVTSDTGSNIPPYTTVIYAQKKTSQTITFGSEQIGNITPSIPGNPFVEGLSNPLNVTDTTPEFSAIYTDGNVADVAQYYQIQVNTTADFTGTVMWDSTKTEYTPGVTNGNRSQDVSYSGSSLNAGSTYYWRIKFWDDNSIGSKESSWSEINSFIMQAPPNTPTDLQTNGTVNPVVLTHVPPSLTAFYSDANSDNATAYQIEVNSSPLFTGTVMWDSGKVATTAISGQRSPSYEYDGTQLIQTNTTLYWHIRFWDTIDAVSEWSNVAQFQDTVTHTYYEGLKLNGLKLD